MENEVPRNAVKASLLFLVTSTRWLLTSGSSSSGNLALMESTCSAGDTDWNSGSNASENLRLWIQSVRIGSGGGGGGEGGFAVSFYDDEEQNRLHYAGRVDAEGYSVGRFWLSMGYDDKSALLNGFLNGPIDENGAVTSEADALFIFPDLRTALVGEFNANTMVAARETRIVAERCKNGLKEVKVARPKTDAVVYRYFRPTEIRTDGPRLRDPYERRTVFIANAGVDMGDGMFAKRNISGERELLAYYSGFIYNNTQRPVVTWENMTVEQVWSAHKYAIELNTDQWMNLPEEYVGLSNYRATLGHFVNHSFRETNAEFVPAFHPRFGDILAIVSTKPIARGEQILLHYGYPIGGAGGGGKSGGGKGGIPDWYEKLYEVEIGPIPREDQEESVFSDFMIP